MLNITDNTKRSKTPVDKERHGSASQRIIEPSLQEEAAVTRSKKLIRPPKQKFNDAYIGKGKYEDNGRIVTKNCHSPSNPLVSSFLEDKYTRNGIATPEKTERSSSKRVIKQGEENRRGNVDAELNKSSRNSSSTKVKIDFVSQIAGLPGSIRAESPRGLSGSIDSYRARGLIPSKSITSERSKRQGTGEVEQWRSSCDFIKHVITTKTYY